MKNINPIYLSSTLALLLMTPATNAAIGVLENPQNGLSAAELFLSVYDSSTGASYTRDLGITAAANNLDTFEFSLAPDALYQSTFANSDAADMRYAVTALASPFFDFSVQVWTTSNDGNVAFPTLPSVTLNAIFNGVGSYIDAVNLAASSTDVAENLSTVIFDTTNAGHYANPTSFNESLASAVVFNTGAPIGTPLAFHFLDEDVFTGNPNVFNFSPVWTLATDGTLTYAMVSNTDTDNDGVSDLTDNCTLTVNTDQTDGDSDGFGNACDTDLNNDCVTNVIDLGLLRQRFFTADAAADFNADGTVNFADLGIFRLNFLLPPGPSSTATCN
ncbi:MAG: thrombospondin type 3 repeat-containing protein [Gammaproteobacteria bacterium]